MASLNLFDGEFDKKTAAPCAGKSATAERDEEDLIVVGYACKLFRDDEKAVEAESMLIPWNGEQSGMQSGKISRYDVRAHLLDVSGDSSESSDSDEEMIEELCDEERYLSLKTNVVQEEEEKEEEDRRQQGAYAQIAYDYNSETTSSEQADKEEPEEESCAEETKMNETVVADEPFVLPSSLQHLNNLTLPATQKLHKIIERTALFVSQQGAQMEIILKAKQASNHQFHFLNMDDPLNPYYKQLVKCIRNGSYIPQLQPAMSQNNSKRDDTPTKENNDDNDNDDSDDEDCTLHPSLFASKQNAPSPIAIPSPTTAHTSSYATNKSSVNKASRNPLFSALAPVSLKSTASSNTENLSSTKSYSGTLISSHYPADSRAAASGSISYHYDPSTHAVYTDDPYATWNASYYGQPADPAALQQQQWDSMATQLQWDLMSGQSQWVSNNPGPPFVPPPPPSYDTPAGILDIPPPPPTDVQAVIDKLAEYVARNGDEFEHMVSAKLDNRFAFLNAGHMHYSYYQWKKQQFAAEHREKMMEQRQREDTVVHTEKDVRGWRPARSVFSVIRSLRPSDRSVVQTEEKKPSTDKKEEINNKNDNVQEKEHVEIVEPIKEITIVKDGGLKPVSVPAPVSAEERLKQERRRKAALLVAKIKQGKSESVEHDSSCRKRSPDHQSTSSNKQSKRLKRK